jgi:hypothetical protein
MESAPKESLRKTFLERFSVFLETLTTADWKKCLSENYRLYNIKQYSIEKLSFRRVKDLYTNLVDKYIL